MDDAVNWEAVAKDYDREANLARMNEATNRERAERAEADLERAQEALRQIGAVGEDELTLTECQVVAREALANET